MLIQPECAGCHKHFTLLNQIVPQAAAFPTILGFPPVKMLLPMHKSCAEDYNRVKEIGFMISEFMPGGVYPLSYRKI